MIDELNSNKLEQRNGKNMKNVKLYKLIILIVHKRSDSSNLFTNLHSKLNIFQI